VDSGEIVAIRAILRKRSQDALLIIEDVLASCPNRPHFIVDRSPWYSKILARLSLNYEQKSRSSRNTIES